MERHSIKSLRYLSIFVIVANIIGNILFFMREKGCKIAFLIDLNIQSIVIFTSFTILMIFLGIESIGFCTLTIFAIKPILSILEYVFGLYTSLNGICKGIDEFDSGTSREQWVVYIIDFKNK